MFQRYFGGLAAVAAVALPLSLTPQLAHAVPVGLELMLLVDVSGSVNSGEYALQKTGYVNAFNNATVQAAIAGIAGGVAVTYIEWSGATQQAQLVGWSLLTNGATSSAFASAINATARAFSGSTAPGSAINFGAPLFAGNGYEGTRLVIDVSGDGAENNGADTSDARDAALLGGVNVINGLPILGEAGLLTFYQNHIQGGTGSFTLASSSFADFQTAIERKLVAEITGTGIPEPATLAILGVGLLGLRLARGHRG